MTDEFGVLTWHTATRSSTTTRTRATSAPSTRATTRSAPAWSGAPACGDVMKLQIKVNPRPGVIEDARFKTYGCGSAIASSSLVTEWVKGKTLDQARDDQEHADRRGAGAAAGEDPLLDPGRGRHQGGGERLQGRHGEARARRRTEGHGSHSDRSRRAPRHALHQPNAARAWACAWASRPPAARAWPTSSSTRTTWPRRTIVFEGHGVKVLVDPKSLPYIDGTQLDFVREGLNEGFKFHNPNEKDRCGCGESFPSLTAVRPVAARLPRAAVPALLVMSPAHFVICPSEWPDRHDRCSSAPEAQGGKRVVTDIPEGPGRWHDARPRRFRAARHCRAGSNSMPPRSARDGACCRRACTRPLCRRRRRRAARGDAMGGARQRGAIGGLKDPLTRATYLCELARRTDRCRGTTARRCRKRLLMQQMEWREALDEAPSADGDQGLGRRVAARSAVHDARGQRSR